MKKFFATLMLIGLACMALPSFAAEPSLHEVYQAANAGRLDEARAMMRDVLIAHPNSAKAHYVEAELLARQGQLKQAASELASAEKLAPGLPFASADAVARLKTTLHPAGTTASLLPVAGNSPANALADLPWGLIAAVLAGIAFIAWAARLMSRRNADASTASRPLSDGFTHRAPAAAPTPYNAPATGYGSPTPPPAGSGLGAQVLGGLATGVAVGAGVAAGEALMRRVMDGQKTTSGFSDLGPTSTDHSGILPDAGFGDPGGEDFGIADASSWDDGGSSDDSDWN